MSESEGKLKEEIRTIDITYKGEEEGVFNILDEAKKEFPKYEDLVKDAKTKKKAHPYTWANGRFNNEVHKWLLKWFGSTEK